MADQGKWFKLWESALDDQELENLSIHEWFCWARLGTYMKKHGKEGELVIRSPGTALQNLMRVSSFESVIRVVQLLPGYVCEEMKSVTANVTVALVTYKIKSMNWLKYQGDYSGERVRRHRQRVTVNVTGQEEKRRRREVDVEEKRKEVSPNPLSASPVSTSKSTAKDFRGKPITAPVIPPEEQMTPEELVAIRSENLKGHPC